jgi:hypothetical protein
LKGVSEKLGVSDEAPEVVANVVAQIDKVGSDAILLLPCGHYEGVEKQPERNNLQQ